MNVMEKSEKKKNQEDSPSLPNPNSPIPFDDLTVVGMKKPTFPLSLFPLTPTPERADNHLSTLGLDYSPLPLSLSLTVSNPNPNPEPIVSVENRPLPIDQLKVEPIAVKRARSTRRKARSPRFNFPSFSPRIPAAFRQKITELGGTQPELVLEKALFQSDVSPQQSRLSLPQGQRKIKLTRDEIGDANSRDHSNKNVVGFEVMVLELNPNSVPRKMSLRRWSHVNSYMLVGSWNKIVKNYELKKHDKLQIWSFRYGPGHKLGLALVKL